MVLITNASMFHRPHVQRGLAILDENNGEIWAKLEAGTEEYFKLVDRTPIPFRQILDNITAAAQRPPARDSSRSSCASTASRRVAAELEAFCDRLNEITAAGGKLKLVQIYTVARRPAESLRRAADRRRSRCDRGIDRAAHRPVSQGLLRIQ